MKTQLKPWVLSGALILGAPAISHAQETLGGLGAAGAAGATLGAAGAGSLSASRMTRGVGSGSGSSMGGSGEPTMGSPGSGGVNNTSNGPDILGNIKGEAQPVAPLPRVQTFSGSGETFVHELFSFGSPPPAPSATGRSTRRRKLSPRAIASLTKAQRTRLVQSKYKIPPRGWLAAYLPQDRYKLGKDWRFVSTEDDHFYYTPPAMAGKRFNPNRVIGFNTWREAMLAGYRPDPRSKPEPAPDIISYANTLSSRLAVPVADLPEASPDVESLYGFVELIYAGQVDENTTHKTLAYAKSVFDTLAYVPTTRWEAKRASVVALETTLLQRPVTDIPIVAGSKAFEARIVNQKDQIKQAVEANNNKIEELAYPIAEDLAYRPGTVGRQIYEIQKLRNGSTFWDDEVRSWLPRARAIVEANTGLHVRDSQSEIFSMMQKESAKARTVNLGKRSKARAELLAGHAAFVSGGNWINHYLPADRSRIIGGVWRFVSTDLDNVFYLPNDARILRQPAGRVIGFNSLNAALEAGYRPAEGGGIDLSSDIDTERIAAEAAKKARPQSPATNAGSQSPGGGGAPQRSTGQ